jgi:hypothetical protein
MRKFFAAAVMLLAAGSTIAAAQETEIQESKNQVAVTIGRTFISDQGVPNTNFFDNTVHFGKGLSFEGDYARRMRRYFWGDLAVEVPVIFNPDEDLNYGMNQIPLQYSSLFITPAARVTFIPNLAVSPWFSFGGGFGHFGASDKPVCWRAEWGSMSGCRKEWERPGFGLRRVTTGAVCLPSTSIRARPDSTIIMSAAGWCFTSSEEHLPPRSPSTPRNPGLSS